MDKVYVMDNRGREKEADKVRYFKYNDNCYFVYTLDEIDNEGYVKLYIKKFVGDEEVDITDEEWPNVKSIVQEVFREIKAGTSYSYEDLDLDLISEIMDSGSKIFKLKKSVVDEITQAKPIKKEEPEVLDLNTKMIKDVLKSTLDKEEVETIGPVSETVKEDVTSSDLNKNLLELLKKSKEDDDLFETPSTLESDEEDKIEPVVEPPIPKAKEREDDEISFEDVVKQREHKLKPVVVGSIPVLEYQEKIEKLEAQIKKYQSHMFEIKKEVDKIRNENATLKEEVNAYKGALKKYEDKIKSLKDIVREI